MSGPLLHQLKYGWAFLKPALKAFGRWFKKDQKMVIFKRKLCNIIDIIILSSGYINIYVCIYILTFIVEVSALLSYLLHSDYKDNLLL